MMPIPSPSAARAARAARAVRTARAASILVVLLAATSCATHRLEVLGPMESAGAAAAEASEGTRLTEPARIDFRWRLNEAGDRLRGVGVARVEPPYRARLDLFLDNGESVISAALVEDDLRLPPGAPTELLPPVDLMWGTLGVFRPVKGARLLGGDRLAEGSSRFRYACPDGEEVHIRLSEGDVQALDVLEDGTVVEWVRLVPAEDGRYPASATYRNLVDFRELEIERMAIRTVDAFDPEIWDPR